MRSRRFLRLLLILALIALVPVGYYLYRVWDDSRQLARLLAELDATQPGWRLAELQERLPALSDEKNAALVIKKAKLGSPVFKDTALNELRLVPYEALTPLQAAELREFVDTARERLAEARQLVHYPEGRFTVKMSPDFVGTLIPHVQDVRDLSRALHLDMIWHIQQGNFEQAAEDLHAARNAGRTLRAEPFLISQLVRAAILQAGATVVERALAQGQPPPKVLARLQELLQDESAAESWFDGVRGERGGMHQLFEFIETGKQDYRLLRALAGGGRRQWHDDVADTFAGFSARGSHVWVLRNFTAQLEARALPPKERRARLNALFDEAKDAPQLARMLMSFEWKRSYQGFLRTEAKLQATCAGLAAERFRQAKGRWPKSLDELVPGWLAKVPIDPLDGEPLRFRLAKGGVVIYSVGPEGTYAGDSRDQGAAPAAEHVGPAHEFRLWNVELRRRPGKTLEP